MSAFVQLIICAVVLVVASHYASFFGTEIAKAKNWSAGFIGVLFLAFATSMPEVFASISVVPECFSIGKIDMGYGNAIGSLIVNLMILAGLDIFVNKGRTFIDAKSDNLITGSYVLGVLSILIASYFLRLTWPDFGKIFNVGVESFIIVILYLIGMNELFQKRHHKHPQRPLPHVKHRAPFGPFFVFLLIVFGLSFWLGNIANTIVQNTNINESFVGSLVMAFVSSLPELTVSLAALRLNSLEMSIGNILGSNFFDSCIVPFMDAVYRPAPIMSQVKEMTPIVTIGAFVVSLVVVLALSGKKHDKKRTFFPSILILLIGMISYWLIYRAA